MVIKKVLILISLKTLLCLQHDKHKEGLLSELVFGKQGVYMSHLTV